MADSIGQVMRVAFFKGHDDGVADEREGLTGGKGKKGFIFETTAPGESSSSGSHNKRHANSPAEGDVPGRTALRRRDWRDGDGERDGENDGERETRERESDERAIAHACTNMKCPPPYASPTLTVKVMRSASQWKWDS